MISCKIHPTPKGVGFLLLLVVNTVKIDVLSWRPNYNTALLMIVVVLGILTIPISVEIVLKIRKKREIGKYGLKNYSKIESE